jgi:uncharacterized protein YoxC
VEIVLLLLASLSVAVACLALAYLKFVPHITATFVRIEAKTSEIDRKLDEMQSEIDSLLESQTAPPSK